MVNRNILGALAAAMIIGATGCVSREVDPGFTPLPPAKPVSFPYGWEGAYAGELEIMGTEDVAMRAAMSLTIRSTPAPDRWSWVIQYEGQPAREYEIVVVDSAIGHYRIDEGNSVTIDGRLMGDTFLSPFGMESTLLSAKYQRVPEGIKFEIVTTSLDPLPPLSTEPNAQTVASYPVQGYQRALLWRIPEGIR